MKDYYIEKEDKSLRLILARGISEFDNKKDTRYREVLQRADDLMYKNKRAVKKLYGLPER